MLNIELLNIEKNHVAKVIEHARREDPIECCGILAGNGGTISHVYTITNTAKSPFRYLMDPQEQLNAMLDAERNGWEFVAFYHSHTNSPAYPSRTDVRMALQSGWLDVFYVLVSLQDKDYPAIRTFQIKEDGSIVEENLEIA